MTEFRTRLQSLVGALCLLATCSFAQTGNDGSTTPNLFTAPSYPAATPSRGSAMAGAEQSGAAGNAGDLAPSRSIQNANGQTSSPRAPQESSRSPELQGYRGEFSPPVPGEFQKFVEAATGRLLPIFGSVFFKQSAQTSTAVDNVPVSADYTVGPGDEIVLRAWGSIDIDYRTTVDRNGMLNLPKVGSFSVSGVKAADLRKNLRDQIGRLYTNFDLSVSLGQLRGLKVFVVGPALRPGVFTLPSQSTMLSAVVKSGGPGPTGSMRKILLRREGTVISELDMYEFLVQGDKSKDIQLATGDVIVFGPVGPRVALTGALDTPAIYELKDAQEPVREVLRYAGGTPMLANPNRAQLERIDVAQPTAARFVEQFKLDDAGLKKTMRDGDVLTLLEISPQFANAVTLRGHVAQPLRYPFHEGMRIRDLIPDVQALVSPDFYRRKNVLVEILDKGDRDRDRDRLPGVGATRIARDDAADGSTEAATDRTGGKPARGSSTQTQDTAVKLGAAAAQEGDASRSDRGSDRQRRDDRAMDEATKRVPTPLFDALNWDYAVIERLNPRDLSTQVIPFNLGKAVIDKDEANNLELRAGDVVTVYSQKDIRVPLSRQTRLVSLEGEVAAPGVYQLLPGDTLKSVIARAGGFTPQAYLYGLEFAREETRRRQRENLNTAIARLESLAAVQAARDAANRRDDAIGAASTIAVSNAATQAQLSRLRAVEPNGRIALELDPGVTLDALPDVPMEGGDRVVVPARPGFVTVAGAVVNSNAYLWRPGRTAGEYLRLAGVDEAADASNAFILRANGTVVHAGDSRSLFGRDTLESQIMQAGDALFVPNQLDFETWGRAFVRNLKDFAQIFSGFGLGLAAIHTL